MLHHKSHHDGPAPRRFELAVESADVGVYEVDVVAGVSRVSDAYIRQLGYSRDEWVDTPGHWASLVHPDDSERVLEINRLVGEGRLPYLEVEYRMRHRDGSWHWVLDRGSVIARDAAGRPLRSVGIHLDINELQSTRAELRETHRRMVLACDAAHIGFWEYDIVNDRQHWDDRVLRMHGITRAEFGANGAAWSRLVHPDDLKPAWDKAQAAWAGTESDCGVDFRIIRPDGEVRHIRSIARITRDAAGKAVYMTGINVDVTEAKLAEQAVARALSEAKAARRAADRASRAKTLFLAKMSHELRTPLSALIALSQAMWMESGRQRLSPRFEKFLNRVRSGGMYLNLVLTNLLDVTAAEAGKPRLSAEDFYLADWLDDVRDILDSIAESHGVRIRWVVPRDQEIRLRTDRMRLSQVLLNLVHNAVKFSQEGRRPVDVHVMHDTEGLRLRVEDSGPGIPAAKLRDIFREFEQHLPPESGFERGVGLGLAVVQANLRLLGGGVRARRRTPRGMSFEAHIPDLPAPRPKIRRARRRSTDKTA